MLRLVIALLITLLSFSIYLDVVIKGQSLLTSIVGNATGMIIGFYAGKLIASALNPKEKEQ